MNIIIHIYLVMVLQVLEACCFVPVTSNAFTLQMEDGITSIYFARNEKQRNEFFELMSKLLSESSNSKYVCQVLSFLIMNFQIESIFIKYVVFP